MRTIQIREAYGEGLVGIWWYTKDRRVIGVSRPLDQAVVQGDLIFYDDLDSHITLWKSVVDANFPEDQRQEIYNKGYRSLERGRVFFDIATQVYNVTCSQALITDRQFRQDIMDYYDLRGCRVEFHPLSHYYVWELTGNPALDQFEGEF